MEEPIDKTCRKLRQLDWKDLYPLISEELAECRQRNYYSDEFIERLFSYGWTLYDLFKFQGFISDK